MGCWSSFLVSSFLLESRLDFCSKRNSTICYQFHSNIKRKWRDCLNPLTPLTYTGFPFSISITTLMDWGGWMSLLDTYCSPKVHNFPLISLLLSMLGSCSGPHACHATASPLSHIPVFCYGTFGGFERTRTTPAFQRTVV